MTKTIALFICLLLFCGAFSACNPAPAPQVDDGCRIFFVNQSEDTKKIVCENIEVDESLKGEELLSHLLYLMSFPGEEGNVSAIPSTFETSIRLSGSIATLNFSGDLDSISPARWSVALSAAALTLLESREINYIYIRCNGETVEPFFDKAIGRHSFATDSSLVSSATEPGEPTQNSAISYH